MEKSSELRCLLAYVTQQCLPNSNLIHGSTRSRYDFLHLMQSEGMLRRSHSTLYKNEFCADALLREENNLYTLDPATWNAGASALLGHV